MMLHGERSHPRHNVQCVVHSRRNCRMVDAVAAAAAAAANATAFALSLVMLTILPHTVVPLSMAALQPGPSDACVASP